MQGEEIRDRLHAGVCVYGTHVTQTSNPVAALMLARAGLDFVFLCSEHMPLDRTEASALSCLYAAKGISPIVRIAYPSAALAAQALDAGAEGIVAPYVETVAQVREVVGSVHYRPIKGRMLEDFLSGTRKPSRKTQQFLRRFNRHHYVIIGIESVAAYENLDALIAVPGVDGVFLGPHDLTVSLEAPEEWDHPDLLGLVEDTIARCRKGGVGVGVHMSPAVFSLDQVRRFMDAGMNWILDGSDVGHAMENMKERRHALGFNGNGLLAASSSAGPSSCAVVNAKPASARKTR